MSEKFQNKYRIASARLKGWDYGCNAIYFITICTQNREHYFGDIVETSDSGVSMNLSEIGELAHKFWMEISNHFPFVQLHEFVVMPNHVHGIIEINKSGRDAINRVCTEENNHAITGGITKDKNPMLQNNLSRIIRWYKGRCTYESRKTNPKFAWQTRFHDHIIRDFDSYHRIEQYIQNNPANWNQDVYALKQLM